MLMYFNNLLCSELTRVGGPTTDIPCPSLSHTHMYMSHTHVCTSMSRLTSHLPWNNSCVPFPGISPSKPLECQIFVGGFSYYACADLRGLFIFLTTGWIS